MAERHRGGDGLGRAQVADVLVDVDVVHVDLVPGAVDAGPVGGQVLGAGEVVGAELQVAGGRRHVQVLHVVADHAVGADERAERAQRLLHAGHPGDRCERTRTFPVERGELGLQQVEEPVGLDLGAAVLVGHRLGRADGPAVGAGGERVVVAGREALGPPAVEHRAVERAVEHGLHARGARGLHRPHRCVEPDVGALDEGPGEGHVVVLDEHEAVPHVGLVGERGDLADELLAQVVGGVGLAGEHELHGALGVEHEPLEPLGLRQQERGPLVGGHAAGEADGERLGVERVVDPLELGGGPALGEAVVQEPLTDVLDHADLGRRVRRPECDVVDLGHTVPGVLAGPLPVVADGAGQDLVHLGRHPGGAVDAVGDGPDRRLVLGDAGPQVGEHLAADLAVQGRHTVAALGQAHAHDRHVEAVGRLCAGPVAQRHERVHRDAALGGPAGEVLLHELAGELVDARGHGGVGGEDGAGTDGLERLAEREAVGLQVVADPLQSQEPGVALVGVEDRDVDAERGERPHAADAEQDLLAQPVLDVAAVEAVRDELQVLGVLGKVGVQQVERRAPHHGPPHLGDERTATHVDRHPHVLAQLEGHGVGVQVGEAFLLPPVGRERLPEVAVAVEEADGHERDAQVGRRLQVVAGEDAQAAGVLRDGLGDAELGREVGDDAVAERGAGRLLEPAGEAFVGVEGRRGGGQPLEERRVGGQLVEAGGADLGQDPPRVVAALVPRLRVDRREQLAGRAVPRPAEVAGEPVERDERLRESGADGEAAEGLHSARGYRRSSGVPLCSCCLSVNIAPRSGAAVRGRSAGIVAP